MAEESVEYKARRVRQSRAFGKAQSRAEAYARDPQRLVELVDSATSKARRKRGKLATIWTRLKAGLRMMAAYARGQWREIPISRLLLLIAAMIYFVMPLDAVPDFIVGLGILDDAALLAWVLGKLSPWIDAFMAWEVEQGKD